MTHTEMTESSLPGNEGRQQHEFHCAKSTQFDGARFTRKKPERQSIDCSMISIDPKDIKTLAKIKGILAKGNNAEVKTGKNGILVMEVKKTIVD